MIDRLIDWLEPWRVGTAIVLLVLLLIGLMILDGRQMRRDGCVRTGTTRDVIRFTYANNHPIPYVSTEHLYVCKAHGNRWR